MSKPKDRNLYGFDDYDIKILDSEAIYNANPSSYYNFYFRSYPYTPLYYVILNDFAKSKSIEENPELLTTTKTLYIHPSCKISRNIVATKYKKCLNPWTADAVVIPKTFNGYDSSVRSTYDNKHAMFVNEVKETVVLIEDIEKHNDNGARLQFFESLKKGTKLRDLFNGIQMDYFRKCNEGRGYQHLDWYLDAEFEEIVELAQYSNEDLFYRDITVNAIPADKLVFETTVMKSLATEENTPTFETMSSIMDMLKSSDDAVVGSAIKALAAMDYMNYPNSVKYVLDVTRIASSWQWNSACDTTAAKFMFKQLFGGTARSYIRWNDMFISRKDYELFEKLVEKYYAEMNNSDYTIDYLRSMSFTYEDENFGVHPRLVK